MKYTLGIDMGVASIGWAVVCKETQFIDCGVRVFPAGVEKFNTPKEQHPNQDRRTARSARRRIRRKAERKRILKESLKQIGMMPSAEADIDRWTGLDVYELRHRAISEKITLEDFGRIILHLNQRRGFLSLRKTEETGDKETQGMLGEIAELQAAIDKSGHQTLGNYLYHLYQDGRENIRLRDRHTRRSMLHAEFDLIWKTQAEFYPNVLTDQLRYGSTGPRPNPLSVIKPIPRSRGNSILEQFGLENMTFFQRSVYWKPSSIGFCELEPEEFRAPIADRRFQRFRMLQEINNLKVLDPSQEKAVVERGLTAEERTLCIEYAQTKKEVKFDALKKHLAKKLKDDHVLRYRFNMEEGGRAKLSGMPTDFALASKQAYGKTWWSLDEDLRNKVVDCLSKPDSTDDDIRQGLQELNTLKEEEIDRLLGVHLPTGYGNLSVKAISKLLPFIEKGMLYHTADKEKSALHAAGYSRRDEEVNKVYDQLPPYEHNDIPHLSAITNPLVKRSLTELRKVINGIIRKHGKPYRIRVEMARELKMGPKQRKQYQKEVRQRETERATAREELQKHGVCPTQDAENLYRLWKEQEGRCAYSCRPIGIAQLLGGEVDIDHIFPFSRSADDSLMNKVVAFRDENREKGNKTPYEWLSSADPEKFDAMCQQARSLPYPKQKRMIAETIPEGFVNRDLNDTAWMAKAARQYLSCLMKEQNHVTGTKGAHTGKLRAHWGLHGLLRSDGIDLKTRDDHRHHALDAAVIALCSNRTIQALAMAHDFEADWEETPQGRRFHFHHTGRNPLDPPWPDFRTDLQAALNRIWVSHRPRRKVSGRIHKETYYGKTKQGQLVVRKPLKNLSDKEVEHIRDPQIRSLVLQHLQSGGSLEDQVCMPSGRPIHKVRILVNYASFPIRGGQTHVQSDATHHLAIFLLPDGKYHFEPVTLAEAYRRLRKKLPVEQTSYDGMPGGTVHLMNLCPGDTLSATVDDAQRLLVFKTMATTSLQTWFADHTDATQGNKDPETGKSTLISCMPGSFGKRLLDAKKVLITPNGDLRNAGG